MNGIYCHPRAYDLAFSYRDYPREVTTLIDWYKEATKTNEPPRTMLELACGPARYAIEFSRNGIGATGLDLSEDMCAYAGLLAKDAATDVRIEHADMTDFDLGEGYDLVILMLNSLDLVVEERALNSHLQTVSRHMRGNGVYLIEHGRRGAIETYEEMEWTAECGEDRVRVRWGVDGERECSSIEGRIAGDDVHIEEEGPMRKWRTAEVMDAARLAGLSLVARYLDSEVDTAEGVADSMELTGATDLGLQHCLCFSRV